MWIDGILSWFSMTLSLHIFSRISHFSCMLMNLMHGQKIEFHDANFFMIKETRFSSSFKKFSLLFMSCCETIKKFSFLKSTFSHREKNVLNNQVVGTKLLHFHYFQPLSADSPFAFSHIMLKKFIFSKHFQHFYTV